MLSPPIGGSRCGNLVSSRKSGLTYVGEAGAAPGVHDASLSLEPIRGDKCAPLQADEVQDGIRYGLTVPLAEP
eukprot:11373504-Alexandrium_andersonii.AAC.1